MKLTEKQQAVLDTLRARPYYWATEAADLAEAVGTTARGVLLVLYRLADRGIVEYTDDGWKERMR